MNSKIKLTVISAISVALCSVAGFSYSHAQSAPANTSPAAPSEVIAPLFSVGNVSAHTVFVNFEARKLGRAGALIGPGTIAAPLHAARRADGSEQVTIRHSGGVVYGRVIGQDESLDLAIISAPSLLPGKNIRMAQSMPRQGEPVNLVYRTGGGGIASVPGTYNGQNQNIGRVSLRKPIESAQYGGAVFDACGYFLGTVKSTARARDSRRNGLVGNNVRFISALRLRSLQGYGLGMASAPCPTRSYVSTQAARIAAAEKKAAVDKVEAAIAKEKAEADAKKAEEDKKAAEETARLKRQAAANARRAEEAEKKAEELENETAAQKKAREEAEKAALEKDKVLKLTEEEKAAAIVEAEAKEKQNYIIAAVAAGVILLLALIAWLLVGRQRKARTSAEIDASRQRDYAENLKSHIPPNPYSDCLLYGDESLKLPGGQLPEAAGGVIVGRHPAQAQVVLDRTDVSRNHARFYVRNNEVYLEDLGSTNGTFVNTRRLGNGEKCVIQTGDYVKFGDHDFEFRKLNA